MNYSQSKRRKYILIDIWMWLYNPLMGWIHTQIWVNLQKYFGNRSSDGL